MQDWRIANGRVEAVIGDSTRSMRTLQLLTYALSEEPGRLEIGVRTEPIEPGGTPHDNTWTGFLIGAGGSIRKRNDVLSMLGELQTPPIASHDEVLDLIEHRRLCGIGLAFIDVHLLASALLTGIPLWTSDQHLHAAAKALGVAYV